MGTATARKTSSLGDKDKPQHLRQQAPSPPAEPTSPQCRSMQDEH